MYFKQCQHFFCVFQYMESEIIDYLTLQNLVSEDFDAPMNQRIRSAFIIAKKQYKNLTEEQKKGILKKLKERK